jgi:hypothetical protein
LRITPLPCAIICRDPFEVDIHHEVKVAFSQIFQLGVAGDAGIVDEDVNPAKTGCRFGKERLYAGRIGYVHAGEKRCRLFAAAYSVERGGKSFALLNQHVTDDHAGAFPYKSGSSHGANAAGAARDDGHLVL